MMAATTSHHPGLAHFWHWLDVQASLYRIYTIGRHDGVDIVPPYNPSSKRGTVPIHVQVRNSMHVAIDVYWVDYKGKLVPKGTIRPGDTWHQTTYIDHPWVFCRHDSSHTMPPQVLCHYIPYHVIPTCDAAPTVDAEDDPNVGVHRFAIAPAMATTPFECCIVDDIFPFPPSSTLQTVRQAVDYALLHCHRLDYHRWHVLATYLDKIIQQPEQVQFRQVRIANANFAPLWHTAAQGILLALGFVEHQGYAELGSAAPNLPTSTLHELQRVLDMCRRRRDAAGASSSSSSVATTTTTAAPSQPLGADGFGRAGYGVAGSMRR